MEDRTGVFPWSKRWACLLPGIIKMSPPRVLSTYYKISSFPELRAPLLLTQFTVGGVFTLPVGTGTWATRTNVNFLVTVIVVYNRHRNIVSFAGIHEFVTD